MKRLLIAFLTFIIGLSAFSQEKHTLDEIKRQAVEIDSLKKLQRNKNKTLTIIGQKPQPPSKH